VERDPLPYALALGIDTEASTKEKQAKTMAQIFTSKGKGGGKSNPIGFKAPSKPYRVSDLEKKQTLGLCRVPTSPTSFNQTPAPVNKQPTRLIYKQINKPVLSDKLTQHALTTEEKPSDIKQIIRVRDSDLMPENYDPVTGEYYRPPPANPPARQLADRLVSDALGKST
jgi:hypothetical protein